MSWMDTTVLSFIFKTKDKTVVSVSVTTSKILMQ